MTVTLSLENLVFLDDGPAREAATERVLERILSAPAFQTLFPGRVATHDAGQMDTGWTDALAQAALQSWLASSGIGWVSDNVDAVDYGDAVDALLSRDCGGHKAVAETAYCWALPSHCHGGGNLLLAYLLDDARHWGNALADYALGHDFISTTGALSECRRAEQLTCLLGKVHWLAPQRIPELAHALGRARAPGIGGIETGFRFTSAMLLTRIDSAIAEGLHPLLNAGGVRHLCGFTLASTLGGESALVEVEPPVTLLTETILRERFAELSESERRMLAGALVRGLPLLRKAIGQFVDPVIQRLGEPPGARR